MQPTRNLADYAIVLSESDNVATALVDMPGGDYAVASCSETRVITITEDIKAGFKVALSLIRIGEKVYKYGHAIGVATLLIQPGDCVHIHNMTSCYTPPGGKRT